MPIPWNMYVANKGNTAPKIDLIMVLAAIAEAANIR